jgi:hypothetical protein
MIDRLSPRRIVVVLSAAVLFAAISSCKQGGDSRTTGSTAARPAASAPAAASVAPIAPVADKQVRFIQHAPRKDQVIGEQSVSDMSMSITIKKGDKVLQEMAMRQGETENKKVTILAATDLVVTSVRCEYLDKSTIGGAGADKEKKKASVVSGKTYLVTAKNGKIEVVNATGRPVSKKERSEVEKDNDQLGKPNKTATLLPDRPIAVGETLTPPTSVIRSLMNTGDDSMEFKDVSLTLKAIEGSGSARAGVFALSMRADGSSKKGDPPVQMALAGTLKILVDSTLPLEVNLSGPISMAIDQKGTSISATGQASISVKATY